MATDAERQCPDRWLRPDFIVVGEKAALGPLRRDLAGVSARWRNELDVRRGLD